MQDIQNSLNTVEGNIAFDKLQALRDASKTGGALGQVSDFEIQLLKATMGSLKQSSTPEMFNKNLDRIEAQYDALINSASKEEMYKRLTEIENKRVQELEAAAPGMATTPELKPGGTYTFNPETGELE
jgi:hypothetical protein